MSGQHTEIIVPFPSFAELSLNIRVGACRLRIRRGSGPEWVRGTYDDPTGSLPSRVIQDAGFARITQDPNVGGLLGMGRGIPTFDLALGTQQPYALLIETGASDSEFELGGIPLTRLGVKVGAGKNVLRFLEPNPQAMTVLDLDAGAGSMELRGLGNANFTDMSLDGGAASFVCDFSGRPQQDGVAHINAGMSSVELAVPRTTAARVYIEATLGHFETSDGFTTRDGGYWTASALEGARPALTIRASIALGTVRLQSM
jgi:hypothetical protein